MDEATLAALNASIKHWEDNVKADTPSAVSMSPHDCALCEQYYHNNCDGCPVSERTGVSRCRRTPYERAQRAWGRWWMGDPTQEAAFRTAPQAMLDFLRSLLPQEGESQ